MIADSRFISQQRLQAVVLVVLLTGVMQILSLCHAATLEDEFGDGSNSSCSANATTIETKILDRGDFDYAYPTISEQNALLTAVDLILAHQISAADTEASPAGYTVTSFYDDDREKQFYILEPIGPGNPGHGYFIFNLAGNRSRIIETPHVGFDTRTVDFGIMAMGEMNAYALLIPGADRYTNYTCDGCSKPCTLDPTDDNSDVTRTEESMFHLIHEQIIDTLVAECRRVLVVQFHGFGSTTQSYAGCDFHFIVSDGDGSRVNDPAFLTRIGERLEEHTINGSGQPVDAYTWNVASNNGNDCSQLLGSINRQGQHIRPLGSFFAHIEMQSTIRSWPDSSDALEVAMAFDESLVGAIPLLAEKGMNDSVDLTWTGGLGDETLYRSTSAPDFCPQALQFPAPAGSYSDLPGDGLFFYRVE